MVGGDRRVSGLLEDSGDVIKLADSNGWASRAWVVLVVPDGVMSRQWCVEDNAGRLRGREGKFQVGSQ